MYKKSKQYQASKKTYQSYKKGNTSNYKRAKNNIKKKVIRTNYSLLNFGFRESVNGLSDK